MDRDSKDNSLIGVFTTSTELIIQVWDDAMAAMTGIDSGDAVGKHIRELIPDIESRGLLARFEFVRDFGTSDVLAPALHKNLIPSPPRSTSGRFNEMRQLVTISAIASDGVIEGLIVVVEDVTARMEAEKDLAEQLSDPDDNVRLKAATTFSNGSETLHSSGAEPVIHALNDKNWRVRRRLVDGLAKRAAPDAVTALLEAVREEHLNFGMLNGALQVLQATSIDTTEPLLGFLRSDDDDLRMQAALALGQQKTPEAVRPLIEALQDKNPNVRYHAIEALGTLQAKEAVEPLLAIAESRDFFLSFAALDALKQIGDRSTAARVAALLDDEILRDAAARTLAATGDVDAAEKIVSLLNEGVLSVSVAADALGSLFDRHESASSSGRQVSELIKRSIRPSAVTALFDELGKADTPAVDVVRLAGWVPDDAVIRKLILLVEDESLRATALAALVAHGKFALPGLTEKLESDDAEIRSDVARAIGFIGTPESIDVLIAAIHADSSIATSALEALGISESPAAMDAIIELLGSPDQKLRRAAVHTLKRFPPPDFPVRLRSLFSDVDPNVRESATRLADALQAPDYHAAVLAGCEDEAELVRIAALEHLRNLPPDLAVPVLKLALQNAAPKIRTAAVQALAAFEGAESIDALESALRDSDAWVRYFAIRSLSENGGASRRRELIESLAEGDAAEHVRVAAAEALGRN